MVVPPPMSGIPAREKLIRAETIAIIVERPKYNKQHKPLRSTLGDPREAEWPLPDPSGGAVCVVGDRRDPVPPSAAL